MNHGNDTRPAPMSEHEVDLKLAHFAVWLEEQAQERRENDELRAALAAAEMRLTAVEYRSEITECELDTLSAPESA